MTWKLQKAARHPLIFPVLTPTTLPTINILSSCHGSPDAVCRPMLLHAEGSMYIRCPAIRLFTQICKMHCTASQAAKTPWRRESAVTTDLQSLA